MDEQRNVPVLEYRQGEARGKSKRRRVLYCIGLPLIAFSMGGGFRSDSSLIGAVGGLLVAFALPIRE